MTKRTITYRPENKNFKKVGVTSLEEVTTDLPTPKPGEFFAQFSFDNEAGDRVSLIVDDRDDFLKLCKKHGHKVKRSVDIPTVPVKANFSKPSVNPQLLEVLRVDFELLDPDRFVWMDGLGEPIKVRNLYDYEKVTVQVIDEADTRNYWAYCPEFRAFCHIWKKALSYEMGRGK